MFSARAPRRHGHDSWRPRSTSSDGITSIEQQAESPYSHPLGRQTSFASRSRRTARLETPLNFEHVHHELWRSLAEPQTYAKNGKVTIGQRLSRWTCGVELSRANTFLAHHTQAGHLGNDGERSLNLAGSQVLRDWEGSYSEAPKTDGNTTSARLPRWNVHVTANMWYTQQRHKSASGKIRKMHGQVGERAPWYIAQGKSYSASSVRKWHIKDT